MSIIDKWDALQSLQVPWDCFMKKDERVNMVLE